MSCNCSHEELEWAKEEAEDLGVAREHEIMMLEDLSFERCGWCGEKIDKRTDVGRKRLKR